MDFVFRAMQKGIDSAVLDREAGGVPIHAEALPEVEAATEPSSRTRSGASRNTSVKLPSHIDRLFATSDGSGGYDEAIAAEQCRTLRMKVLQLMRSRNAQSLLVTSSLAGEGKTVTAVNLAFGAAAIERLRILLVDGDLRKPSVATMLGMSPDRGLDTYLRRGAAFDEVCWTIKPNLSVLPAVHTVEEAAELLSHRQLAALFSEAKQRYDLIIVDTPPIGPVSDALILLDSVDAALFCARANRTPVELMRQHMKAMGAKLIGSVLIGHTEKGKYYPYYGRAKG
jgi:capsular exopolysaccharide synthesis family protein